MKKNIKTKCPERITAVDDVRIVKVSCMEYPPGSGYYYCFIRVRAHIPLPTSDCAMEAVTAKVLDNLGGLKTSPATMSLEPPATPPNPDWYTTPDISLTLRAGEQIHAHVDASWKRRETSSADSAAVAPCP